MRDGGRDDSPDGPGAASFWAHFETLTRIARPSRHEEPVIEHVRAWAAAQRLRARAGRGPQPRHPRACDARPRVGARHSSLQGHLDMVCERDPASAERPDRGADRARPRRRLADGGRDDARRRRRRRDRRDDGAGRGRVDPARPARAADDGRRGGRARGRERPRRLAAHRLDPDQPRQRGGRRPHRRVRRQHRHVGPGRSTARGVLPGCGRRCRSWPAAGSAATRASRSRSAMRTRSRCSAGCCARRTRPRRSGSSRSTAGRAATRSPATPSRSARFRAIEEAAFRAAVESATATVRDAYAKTDPGATVTVERRRRRRRRLDGGGDGQAARRRRARPDRAARDEPRLRRARRDEHLARRGDDRGRPPDAAQPVALVERLGAARGDRRARRGGARSRAARSR